MLYSMTGYGRAEGVIDGNKHLQIEIRSVNGKNFDIFPRYSSLFRPFEIEIRKLLKEMLTRGTIDISIRIVHQENQDSTVAVDKKIAGEYYRIMQALAHELNIDPGNTTILQTIMNLPDVIAPKVENIDESQWGDLSKIILEAAEKLSQYRQTEGATIEKDLLLRVHNIETLLSEVETYETQRVPRIRERIHNALADGLGKDKIDENRFEQELIYYIEKLDISEEKQRLATHCKYFETLSVQGGKEGLGKKLGFVLQEMGREINTMGSKSNDAEMQQIVVNMKDELEKAKEQILNVL